MMTLNYQKKWFVLLFLGFSSGVPLALTGSTLQAWLASEKVDLTVIGIFSAVGLPYSLKFLWSPFIDRYTLPFMGRRRGWIMIFQILLVLSILMMGALNPTHSPFGLALLAIIVAFFSASQDIVVDAYRTELLTLKDCGIGNAFFTLGYRVAMFFSGAIALMLADYFSWFKVYSIMAGSMLVGVLTHFFSFEDAQHQESPRSLREAVVAPLYDFFRRKNVVTLLSFMTLYKLDVVFAVALMTPFMLDLGFTKTEIGAVAKGFGLIATLLGVFVGGYGLSRFGIKKSLFSFGFLQGISGFSFFFLAKLGHHYPMMVVTISVENFFSGMGTAAYSAFMMSLCNPQYTATQFALLTSLMALSRNLIGIPTGFFAKHLGWENYFLLSIFFMIPGLVFLKKYDQWMKKTL